MRRSDARRIDCSDHAVSLALFPASKKLAGSVGRVGSVRADALPQATAQHISNTGMERLAILATEGIELQMGHRLRVLADLKIDCLPEELPRQGFQRLQVSHQVQIATVQDQFQLVTTQFYGFAHVAGQLFQRFGAGSQRPDPEPAVTGEHLLEKLGCLGRIDQCAKLIHYACIELRQLRAQLVSVSVTRSQRIPVCVVA